MIKKMKNFKLINKMYLDILLRNNIIFVYIKTTVTTDINILMYSYYSNVNFLFFKFFCVLFIFSLLFNLFHSMKKKILICTFGVTFFKFTTLFWGVHKYILMKS